MIDDLQFNTQHPSSIIQHPRPDHDDPNQENQAHAATSRSSPLPKGERGGIELLLIHSVEHLGKQGEVVEVRPGYAYNYLIPQGLATLATRPSQADGRQAQGQAAADRAGRGRPSCASRPPSSAKQSITIEANATEDGHLYGSVGATEIVAALKNNDIHSSADQIRLEGPLKELGLYTVKIRCSSEVEGELKVWVVPAVADRSEVAFATSRR